MLFIPTGISPHKELTDLLASFHRYQMVKDAISDNEHFEVSDLEIKLSGKSYTIDTISTLKEMYGKHHDLFLIMGTDMINEISTWKAVDVLSSICNFIVVNRFPASIHGNHSQTSFLKRDLSEIAVFCYDTTHWHIVN
ncbi:MAG: nadD [Candidatus Brocadiaceae bacterium]|nr:nadD [Candidatus Brocadiaceae bacterium]